MNAKLVALATLLVGSGLAFGQDIVLKATYSVSDRPVNIFPSRVLVPIDVNGDGIKEVPIRYNNEEALSLFDVVTSLEYNPQCFISNSRSRACVAKMRSEGVAEWVSLACDYEGLKIADIATGDVC